jgi:glycosyltransferase involved in cell wall biosynthesis
MRTVLVLAVNYPPKGGVGVIRTLKFVRYLPQFGWRPIVVTPGGLTKRIKDPSLVEETAAEVEVHRPPFWNLWDRLPGDIAKLLKAVLKPDHFPDTYRYWNRIACAYIEEKILPKTNIDAAYVSAGPHSTILLARELFLRHKIPYCIDLRDPFSFSQYSVLRKDDQWRCKATEIETQAFSTAGCINNVTRQWHTQYRALYPDFSSKFSFIPNGYDEADFAFAPAQPSNKVFTIGYNGSFSRLVPLVPLIDAMSAILQEKDIPIRLSIATPIKEVKLKKIAGPLYDNGLIDFKGYLSHQKSLQTLSRADACALMLADSTATEGMVPAKTYEYMRIGKPILCCHRRDGHLAELIKETDTGVVADIHDGGQIQDRLLDLHQSWARGTNAFQPIAAQVKKYERKRLTHLLSERLNQML